MSPEPSRVLPVLRLAVLCEDVEEDGSGRPAVLSFPVHTIRFPPGTRGNYRPPVLTTYLQLQGGRGAYFFRILMRSLGGVSEVAAAAPIEAVLDRVHEVAPLELAIKLHRLVFPKPGVYELCVYANSVSLHESNGSVNIPFPAIRVAVLSPDGSERGVE